MGLYENMRREPIDTLSVRSVLTIDADESVRNACEMMREADLGAVIVVDSEGVAVGMINEKHLIRILSDRPDAIERPVRESMTTNLTRVRADQPIAELVQTMQDARLRWVCIVDDAGRPIGLTGLRGVMEYVGEHFARQVMTEPINASTTSGQREGA